MDGFQLDAPQIVERLRKYAEALMERSLEGMATLATVEPDDNSEAQRVRRVAMRRDYTASCELSGDADEIEAAGRRNFKPAGAQPKLRII